MVSVTICVNLEIIYSKILTQRRRDRKGFLIISKLSFPFMLIFNMEIRKNMKETQNLVIMQSSPRPLRLCVRISLWCKLTHMVSVTICVNYLCDYESMRSEGTRLAPTFGF